MHYRPIEYVQLNTVSHLSYLDDTTTDSFPSIDFTCYMIMSIAIKSQESHRKLPLSHLGNQRVRKVSFHIACQYVLLRFCVDIQRTTNFNTDCHRQDFNSVHDLDTNRGGSDLAQMYCSKAPEGRYYRRYEQC